LLAGAIALSTWQAWLSRDAPTAHWMVALLAVAGVVAAAVLGRGRQRLTTRTWVTGSVHAIWTWRRQPGPAVAGAVIWTILLAGVVGWDLVSFIYQSHLLPTLSYFIGRVTRYRVGRGLFFALWLFIGSYLVSAWRAETRR
jgi:hypothetical protein